MSKFVNNSKIKINYTRDKNINNLAQTILCDRYLLEGEFYQELFARIAKKYSDNFYHSQRIYDYMSKLWFMPATPILINGNTNRGLPISCFLNEVEDNLKGIVSLWNENIWLSSKGGGIGTYWGNIRSVGEKISHSGKSSGIIPFLSVQDKLTLAISQGNLRRGSAAIYLPISHPEIEEFIEIRKATGGDPNRKTLNLHHGVIITDVFMKAVEENLLWKLRSSKEKIVVSVIKARVLWTKILITRMETGEPYILFIDTINKNKPYIYKKHNMMIQTSNLCTEIVLTTGKDFKKRSRTAVCCLSSINLEKYNEWKNSRLFIIDIMMFLDNILQDFIDNSPDIMSKARYAANRERSVGLGVMGLHSFFQLKGLPFDSITARIWNIYFFKYISKKTEQASKIISTIKHSCPDAEEINIIERFVHKIAIAPTASISIIVGTSPSIEPYNSNFYIQKTMNGSFSLKNKYLRLFLKKKYKNKYNIWKFIMKNEGSISQLNFLKKSERSVFKTAFEICQEYIINLASDRSKYICQTQSINIFLVADTHKTLLNKIHYYAWKKGIKSLYYNRSKSLQRSINFYK